MQIGLFSVAAYPYSFKLLWSPIVDSIYFKSFGRRKSWLVPLQLLSAVLMATFAPFIEAHVAAADVPGVTVLFFCLVLLAATQVRTPHCPRQPTGSRRHSFISACAKCLSPAERQPWHATLTVRNKVSECTHGSLQF